MLPVSRRVFGLFIAGFVIILTGVLVALYALDEPPRGHSTTSDAEDQSLGHVHGLGINPADGALFVATHNGVFRFADGIATRVADRWQDTMGFAVTGPDRFLASGHPDLREDLPPHLGLIESTDAARSWQALSLLGEADLHAIEATDQTVYAYDATAGQLIATDDRRTWRVIDQQPLIDLAAPSPTQFYATSQTGRLLDYGDGSKPPVPVAQAPVLVFIDADPDGRLLGVGPDGRLFISSDGTTWSEAGAVDGAPQAVDAAAGQWHVATDRGIYRSIDNGRSWESLLGGTP